MSDDERDIRALLESEAERAPRPGGLRRATVRQGFGRRIGVVTLPLLVVASVAWVAVASPFDAAPKPERDVVGSDPEIAITRDALDLPDGCGVRDSVSKLLSVTEAINEGDMEALEASFATGNHFSTVGISDPHGLTGPATMDREALMSYLLDRIDQGESYRVTKATVTNQPGPGTYPTNMTRVDFLAMRTADDIDGALEYRGWAKVDCPSGRITMVNLGHRSLGESIDTWCPPAPFGTSSDVVIACSQDFSDRSLVVFPTQPTLSGMESMIRGRVLQRRRCLVVQPVLADHSYLPLWPRGYSYQLDEDQDIVVLDENGDEVFKEGERVILGGGRLEAGPRPPEEVEREVQHCDGPYWVTGTVAKPGGSS